MPSPLRTFERGKKHSLLGSKKSEESGSSDVKRKKLKRDDGLKQLMEQPSEISSRGKWDMEPVVMEKKRMDGRTYKSFFKKQRRRDVPPGSSGVPAGGGKDFQFLPRPTDCVESKEDTGLHDVQQSLQGLLKPEILKLCEILQLSEDVKVMVGRFLEHVIDKHHVSWEPKSILQAFQISLCWSAASLLKCKIHKKESLLLAKQHLQFDCSGEEVSNVYSKLRKLKKTFLFHVDNFKELKSSIVRASTTEGIKQEQDKSLKRHIEENDFSSIIKHIKRKLEKRMKMLFRRQQKEIDEFYRIWKERGVELQKQHRQTSVLISSRHSNNPVRLDELKRLDDEFAKKMEEHRLQREVGLKDLKAQQLLKKYDEMAKKARWLEKINSFPQANPFSELPRDGSEFRGPFETPAAPLSPDHGTIAVEYMASSRASIDETGKFSNLQSSANASDNCSVPNPPFSEEQIPDVATPKAQGGLISTENELALQDEHPRTSTSSGMHDMETPAIGNLTVHENDAPNLNLAGAGSTDQMHDMETPATGNSTVHESDAPNLNLAGVGPTNQINHELAVTNPSEMSPSNNLLVNQNQPCSGLASGVEQTPDSGGLIVVLNSESSQQFKSPTDQINHELAVTNPSETSPSNVLPVDQNLPCSSLASGVEYTLDSGGLIVSLNLEAPQPLPSNESALHPGSERCTSLQNAEVSPQAQPIPGVERTHPSEGLIVSANSEGLQQFESQLLPSNQLVLHPGIERCTSSQNAQVAPPLVEDTAALLNQVVSQTHLGTASSIDNAMGESRTHPTLYGARQAAPQMLTQRLHSDPLQNELERLSKEAERAGEDYENMKLQMISDREKEIAEIRQKYKVKVQDAEAALTVKKKELDTNHDKVLMNKILAEAFLSKQLDFKPPLEMQSAASIIQQVHLQPSQAQPTSSPSPFTNLASFAHHLSVCRPNRPHFVAAINPPFRNFQVNGTRAPGPHLQPLRPSSISAPSIASAPHLQPFRSSFFVSGTSSASVPQRTVPRTLLTTSSSVPLVPPPPRLPPYHSGNYNMGHLGPRSEVAREYLSLQNSSLSSSTLLANVENQAGACPLNSSLPVPILGLSQFEVANNGGSGTINVGRSGEVTNIICLSDDG